MDHKELDAWKESIKLVKDVYAVSKGFPAEEMYGLTSQIRRAAVSIPSNIAEGAARASNRELIRYLYISLGSLAEVETQLIIAIELSYIQECDLLFAKITTVRKLQLGLIRYLKNKK